MSKPCKYCEQDHSHIGTTIIPSCVDVKIKGLEESLLAEKDSGIQWQNDCTALCESVGEPVNAETSDSAAQSALEKIEALKHIAVEIAAHGECQCEEGGKERCLHCVATNLFDDGIRASESQNEYLIK